MNEDVDSEFNVKEATEPLAKHKEHSKKDEGKDEP
jgi:hypothetical protein